MPLDSLTIWAAFLVFLRCSALLLSAPIFSSQQFPAKVRVLLAVVISLGISAFMRKDVGAVPDTLLGMILASGHEILVGLVIGSMYHLVIHTVQIAGSIMDLQVGLSSSQALNPVTGVSVTIISQFKTLLATVIFLSSDSHHIVIQAFVKSYTAAPVDHGLPLAAISGATIDLMSGLGILAIQIAAPLIAVSLVVDAALGLVNRAVPQMQVFVVGMPVKQAAGLTLIAVILPAVTTAVEAGVNQATQALMRAFGGA